MEESPGSIVANVLQILAGVVAGESGPLVVLPRPLLDKVIEDLYVVLAVLRHGQ